MYTQWIFRLDWLEPSLRAFSLAKDTYFIYADSKGSDQIFIYFAVHWLIKASGYMQIFTWIASG